MYTLKFHFCHSVLKTLSINISGQTYIEEEIALFIIAGIENVYLWRMVEPRAVLPSSGTACGPHKYGMVEREVLDILGDQTSK